MNRTETIARRVNRGPSRLVLFTFFLFLKRIFDEQNGFRMWLCRVPAFQWEVVSVDFFPTVVGKAAWRCGVLENGIKGRGWWVGGYLRLGLVGILEWTD